MARSDVSHYRLEAGDATESVRVKSSSTFGHVSPCLLSFVGGDTDERREHGMVLKSSVVALVASLSDRQVTFLRPA
jgi:hypothetical protein